MQFYKNLTAFLRRYLNPRILLQIGVAFGFIYAAIAAFMNPLDWIGYFPQSILTYLGPDEALRLFGITEIVLGIWLLSGWKLEIPSLIAFVMLLGITLSNLVLFDVVFRDIGLAFAALALLALVLREKGDKQAR